MTQKKTSVAEILNEEEQMTIRYQVGGASLEEAKRMSLSYVKDKYRQEDI